MDKTKIQWIDATWGPIIRGCSKISEGCQNCYAERMAARFSGPGMPYEGTIIRGHWNGKIKTVPEALYQPLQWKQPRRIFVNSMSDLFHENMDPKVLIEILTVISQAPQHTFQILTKRPERMLAYFSDSQRFKKIEGTWSFPLPNVWLGVSVEDQKSANERIPFILQTPAAVRFVSAEPLLGPINFGSIVWNGVGRDSLRVNDDSNIFGERERHLDWIIAGGESGPNARPMHPAWARGLRDQCRAAGVPFFFKQWGEWLPLCQERNTDCVPQFDYESPLVHLWPGSLFPGSEKNGDCIRVGKKRAGRQLDKKAWEEFPK